jgi:hypothetical protein
MPAPPPAPVRPDHMTMLPPQIPYHPQQVPFLPSLMYGTYVPFIYCFRVTGRLCYLPDLWRIFIEDGAFITM